ncbi:glycosyltransferase [Hydrogenophaga laconesensis]|uniref:Rhamnosyltransferase n=1 Tax=Hydrogenophaga laconesensis TaxID=1805971 RepID=A0ABU1VHG3_9BURK|nr:glycosyltransferase [Hydrogenophaga laconesensis]MDR7096755.1 rhamnosyltransferase [Hydrogenophaga laconesensis]
MPRPDSLHEQTPHVRVLLATFNGAPWLDAQLESVLGQQGVRVSLVASDDSSSDNTLEVLQRWASSAPVEILPPATGRFGSAHRNFLRLIRDAQAGNADFFALSDQDDIWLPGKLVRGIECLNAMAAQGYSSNVTAVWPDGRRQLIDKAQPQRAMDHLFESPGPGCTFVLPRHVFLKLKAFVMEHFDRLQSIWVHDWLIYAFVRSTGGRWHIDSQALMLYRQHGHNEIGVNAGWRAAMNRWKLVRSGAYRRDVLAIADATGVANDVVKSLRRLNVVDRMRLILRARECRRRLSECLMLAVLFLVMPRE